MIEDFELIHEELGVQIHCRSCGEVFPIFPVHERWADRAIAVHCRDQHGDGGIRIPYPKSPKTPSPLKAEASVPA